jgi:predicted Zn-dependent peptidase
MSLIHDADKPADEIIKVIDEEIAKLQAAPVSQADLDLARVKQRSRLYSQFESSVGFGKANLLASFALFDNDPARINRLEEEFRKVTPALIQQTAKEYLRPTNRTILTLTPKPAAPAVGQF